MKLKRFDYKLKESKKKPIIIGSVFVMILLIGVTIYNTYAEYKVTNSYNILQGKVGEFTTGDVIIAVKLIDAEGNETDADSFPTIGYTFDAEKSGCENGSVISYNNGMGMINEIIGKDKCTFYFNSIYGSFANAILSDKTIVEETPNFCQSTIEKNNNLYSTTDDYGISYYFRGDVENNYVEFGTWKEDATISITDDDDIEVKAGTPMYWRIVRINGDGSIRLIYDGIEKVANGNSYSTIAESAYSTITGNIKYVGYTYDVDGTETDSTIKGVVDAWYEKHLETTYGSYIKDSIFCNDRNNINSDYAFDSTDRLTSCKPTLTCTNKSDRYTVEDTTNGNGYLSNPVGLLTADEVKMAGEDGYISSAVKFWTMTPAFQDFAWLHGNYLDGDWEISSYYYNVRPVINLKSNVKFEGDGSYETPYKIITE